MAPALPPELADDWTLIRSELRRAVGDATFDIWLQALRPRALIDDTLVLDAPAEIRGWVADRFGRVLQTCAATVLGPETVVDVVAPDTPLDPPTPGQVSGAPQVEAFSPKLTFDHFVIGDCNRFAHAAALAVAELPGQAYNPLFLCGPPGVGKTHLLHSIGNYVRRYGGGLTVRHATVEEFTNDFVSALQSGSIERFKSRFRRTDVLLIDDVQFLQSKVKTEEEFFHTFNALYESGSQIVLTSDRPPRDLEALEDRLRERFESGLVAEVLPPEPRTRLAILRKRVQHDGIALDDESALHAISERITDNARALEGALIRVVAFHSLTGRAIDTALADEVLSSLYPGARRPEPPPIERIQQLTSQAFGITPQELVSAGRGARVSEARQIAMFLVREQTAATLPVIGGHFGGRSHTTVLHACRRAAERIAADPDLDNLVSELRRRLTERDDDRLS